MPDWLRQRAHMTPVRLALISGADRLTYAELDDAVDGAATRLQDAGLRPGDVAALLARNGTSFVLAVHALARIGAGLMPLNLRLTPTEITWQLRHSGSHVLLHDESQSGAIGAAQADAIAARSLNLQSLTSDQPGAGARFASQEPGGEVNSNATHSIVYTSGTSGTPKGAVLTYGNHLWSAVGSALNLGLREDDRWLACLPLFHVGGLAILLRSVIYGTTAFVHDGFDPARVNAAIDHEGVTIVSVVANMLQRMLDERGDRPYPPSLRCALLGGGPAPEPLLRRCAAIGVPVVQTYGLTETASQVATLAPEDALRKLGSAGKPLFGSQLRIEGPDGSELPPGAEGEIVVRGPTVTPGYLNDPEATARAIRDGWLHTGDIGYLDPEGYLYVLDRRDDLIVSGGENIYPAEVEAVLQSHPDVVEAGVYGVPDERWGQTPIAVAVLRSGATVTADALLAYCKDRLAAFKVPSRIEFATELPRNAAGKLLRRELGQRGS
jgi:O-succinylbenzoic acid--CoA ligase